MSRLLIVDDDPDLLILLDAHYSVHGHKVSVALNCEEALLLAAANPPAVILLDFCLPRMDGGRFIEVLRGDALTAKTPVIVMSAANKSWVKARLPSDPLIRVIEKPFDFRALDPMVEDLVTARAA